MLSPGTLISSKYRIERVLGEGGMGIVYEATHVELEGRVALKFLRPEALERSDIVARFAQEARAAVRLKSEHVARVHDVGTHDRVPYLVMELLEGRNLEEVLAASGPLPPARVAEHVIDACEGISEAHARGIIHRDIKPANLFLVENEGLPTIKVLDFGISKAALTGKVSDVDVKSSSTTSIMGSPHYMSPEQIRSTRDVDLRTDVWSLGVVVYELLTGRTPFDDKAEFTELVAAILEDRPPAIRAVRPEVPPELEAVVTRCLQRDRSLRYQTAAELALALLPFTQARSAGVVAARAVAVVKRAGLAPDLVAPKTLPPPPSSDPDVASAVSSAPLPAYRAPSVDQLGKTAVKSDPPEALIAVAKASRTPLTAGTTLTEANREPRSGRALPFVAVLALLAIVSAVAFFMRGKEAPTAATAASASPGVPAVTAPPVELAVVAPTAASDAAAPEVRTAVADPVPAVAVPAAAPAPGPRAPKATPKKPEAARPHAAPTQDLDIRRER